MTNRAEAPAPTRYHLNGFAQVMERTGLAIMGALCGLFVAAMVARADIEEINSLGALLSAVLYGSLGFYLRTAVLQPYCFQHRLRPEDDSAGKRHRRIRRGCCRARIGPYDHL